MNLKKLHYDLIKDYYIIKLFILIKGALKITLKKVILID